MSSFKELCEAESSFVAMIAFPTYGHGNAGAFGDDKISVAGRGYWPNSVLGALDNTAALTVLFAGYPNNVASTERLIGYQINGTASTGLHFSKVGDDITVSARSEPFDGTQSASRPNVITINTLFTVSAVLDFANDNIRIGVDGSYTDTAAAFSSGTADYANATGEIGIGQHYNGANTFDGDVTAAAIFSAALSDAAIDAIFAADSILAAAGGGGGSSAGSIMSALSMST